MEASIRYRGDGRRRIWFIPFPYGCVGDVGVSVLEDGVERVVEDWQELEHCVIYPVPDQAVISIWRRSSDVECEAGEVARVNDAVRSCAETAAPVAAPMAVVAEPAVSEPGQDPAEGLQTLQEAADQEVERLQDIMDYELNEARSSFRSDVGDELDEFRESVQALEREALTKIAAAATVEIAKAEKPGLVALPSLKGIERMPPIFYVVNAELDQATPALGLFPAERVEDAQWEGFFIIVPGCPWHWTKVAPSFPTGPGRPADLEDNRGVWWQPCEHEHIRKEDGDEPD